MLRPHVADIDGRIQQLHQTRQKIDAEVAMLNDCARENTVPPSDVCTGGQLRSLSTEEILDHLFTYHAPTGEAQLLKYQSVRDAAKAFALAVWRNCPYGADRTAAIRQVREAMMTANASIALDGLSFS